MVKMNLKVDSLAPYMLIVQDRWSPQSSPWLKNQAVDFPSSSLPEPAAFCLHMITGGDCGRGGQEAWG